MAGFVARVELHGASWSDYISLHAAMRNSGFAQTIKGSDGNVYHLPTAEYYFAGNYTLEQVRDLAWRVAGTVSNSYEVFVTQSGGSAWQGLQKA